MSVLFTGFSGLACNPQHTLLLNQDTWCVSFRFRLASGSSTASDLMNQTMLMTCQPQYPPEGTVTPQLVMQFSLLKAFDPSLIGIYGGVAAGGQWAQAWTSGVDAFAGHHVLMYGIPVNLIDSQNPDSGYTQGLFMYVDGSPVDTLDQDVGVGHNPNDGGISAIDPYVPADSTKDPNYSIRIGNPNIIQLYPGYYGTAYASGQVSFSLEDFAIWHGFTPEQADVVALRDLSKRPGDFATGLQVWWKMDGTSGTVSGSDTDIQNSASSGEHDLHIV